MIVMTGFGSVRPIIWLFKRSVLFRCFERQPTFLQNQA